MLRKRSINDASAQNEDITPTTADSVDLPSAQFPIAIGDPSVPGSITMANFIEYLRDSFASFIVGGTNVTVTHDDNANTLTITATDTDTNTQRSDEDIRDVIAAFVQQGSNVTVTHDDANDTLTIASTDTGLSAEEVRDTVAAFVQQGDNVTITHDDANDTLTITSTDTDTNTQRTDEEIRDTIAAFIQQGSNVTVTHDDANDTLTIASTDTNTDTNTQRTDEDIRDVVAAFVQQGSNVTVTHDDANDTLTIDATATGGLDAESVRDTIAAFIQQGDNVTVTHDDANDTLTIASTDTDTNTQRTDEDIRDVIAAFVQQGSNVTITHDDANDTLTIASTDTGLSAEEVRDTVAAFVQQGSNVTITHDDANDTLTIDSTATGGLDAESVRDTVASFVTGGENVTVTHDDAGDSLTINIYDFRYSETDIGNWNVETSNASVDGDIIIRWIEADSEWRLDIVKTDADGNNKTTPVDAIAIGDIVVVESQSDTTKRVYFKIKSSSNFGTNTRRCTADALGYSSPTTDVVVDEAAVNVYHSVLSPTRTDEDIRDVIAAFIQQGSNVTVTHDDANDTLTIASTDTGLDAEGVRDTVAAFVQQGSNVTVTHDDANDTLTIAATDTGLDAEGVRDTVASFVTPGANVYVTHNDTADTLTIDSGQSTFGYTGNWLITGVEGDGTITIPSADDLRVYYNETDGTDRTTDLQSIQVGDKIRITNGTNTVMLNVTDITEGSTYITYDVEQLSGVLVGTFGHNDVITLTGIKSIAVRTDEEIRDVTAAFVTAGTDITVTHNDAANTLTIDADSENIVSSELTPTTIWSGSISTTDSASDQTDPANATQLDGDAAWDDWSVVLLELSYATVSMLTLTIVPNQLSSDGDAVKLIAPGNREATLEREGNDSFWITYIAGGNTPAVTAVYGLVRAAST